MRIGFDGKRAVRNFRGLGNYSRGLIEGLLEYSEHDLFLYAENSQDKRALKWLEENTNSRLHVKNPQGVINNLFPTWWRSYSLSKDLKQESLDIYHGLSHEIPYNLTNAKFKKVVTIHDLIFIRYPHFFPWIDRLSYQRKFSYALKNADMVIAICEQTKSDLIELMKVDEKKIVIHYQSCDPIFYQSHPDDKIEEIKKKNHIFKDYILNVGAFEERKNQLTLIEAFAKKSSSHDLDLVFIGNGKEYLKRSQKRVEELGLKGRIHFLEGIPFNELPYLYQGAKLFCFPSFFEGFGIPIVEALFSKIPVITSEGSCFPESAGTHSIFVDPYSVNELSDKMIQVISNSSLRAKMIENGLLHASRFHRKEVTYALLEHYRQLLSKS